jgi:hypothetical protein
MVLWHNSYQWRSCIAAGEIVFYWSTSIKTDGQKECRKELIMVPFTVKSSLFVGDQMFMDSIVLPDVTSP